MEQNEFNKLMIGLINHLEEKETIKLISDKETISTELNNLFIDCENYDNNKRNRK